MNDLPGHAPAWDESMCRWITSAAESVEFYAWAETQPPRGNVTEAERIKAKGRRWAHVKRLHHERLRKAMPPWADGEAMRAIYAEARRRTRESGEPHEVDHVIPLLGRHVSGLHVEYNLRVVHRTVNRRKSNRL